MQPKWIIQRTAFNDWNPRDIERHLDAIGVERFAGVLKDGRAGLSRGRWKDKIGLRSCVVAYGSIEFVKALQAQHKFCHPIAWIDWPAFDCTGYYPGMGPHLLNREYMMLPAGDAFRREAFIYGTLGMHEVFCRPNANDKAFSGSVIPREEFQNEMMNVVGAVGESGLIVFARVEKIESESRVLCCGGEFVTGSGYMQAGEYVETAGVTPEEEAFAAMMHREGIDRGDLPRMICMDIARTPDGLKLIEISCPNTSGLYKCSMPAFVDAANRVAVDDFSALDAS